MPWDIETNILANENVLKVLEEGETTSPVEPQLFRRSVFRSFRSQFPEIPDHIFSHQWECFLKNSGAGTSNRGWAVQALYALAERYLELRWGRVTAKLESFQDWQSLLSRISCLPLKCALYARHGKSDCQKNGVLQAEEDPSFFPVPWIPSLEDLIDRQGLHETHLHLNGSTMAEVVWLRGLRAPEEVLRNFAQSYKENEGVKELALLAFPDSSEDSFLEEFRQRILRARNARSILRQFACRKEALEAPCTRSPCATSAPGTCGSAVNCPKAGAKGCCGSSSLRNFLTRELPCAEWQTETTDGESLLRAETLWQTQLMIAMGKKPWEFLDRIYLLYLITKNRFMQLLVQRDDMYGFEEFQKVTGTDLRTPVEKDYRDRFVQFHGGSFSRSDVVWFEGRFAPKKTPKMNEELLQKILMGYIEYLSAHQERDGKSMDLSKVLDTLKSSDGSDRTRPLRLALVAHFIKKKDNARGPVDGVYPFQELREECRQQGSALLETFRRYPQLREWVRGVDAAANELDTPPEVFAPLFRFCRRIGIEHATYHVGEDFLHLVGGIRQVEDAVRFLQLGSGDRIGHATALGIDPRIWMDTMPSDIRLPKGEWMLDLLSVWRLLRHGEHGAMAERAASEACALAIDIFQETMTIEFLDAVMELRRLCPKLVTEALDDPLWTWEKRALACDEWLEEARLVAQKREMAGGLLRYLKRWWCEAEIRKRAREHMPIREGYLPFPTLVAFQQAMLQVLHEKGIVIETLPTSNVRISQYRSIREHHIFRWLGVPGAVKAGDPPVAVSLGTDDPGIFATSLKAEMYHLYVTLKQDFGLGDCEAVQYLEKINDRGRIYRFHARLCP